MEGFARRLKAKELYPAVFSRHALAYQRRLEDVMARGEARGRQAVLDYVDARPGMRVIDLACGPGTLTARLAAQVRPGGEVVGVDLAQGMIDLARAAATPSANFLVMDIEHLEFATATFDAGVCGHGLQFAPNLDLALGEARRVLKGGSRFAASIPVSTIRQSVTRLLDPVIDRWLAPAPKAVDEDSTRATVADSTALSQAALRAGFAGARVEQIEEKVRWASAEELVALTSSWWDCAARLEATDPHRREAFHKDALATLTHRFRGPIEADGQSHVLLAIA